MFSSFLNFIVGWGGAASLFFLAMMWRTGSESEACHFGHLVLGICAHQVRTVDCFELSHCVTLFYSDASCHLLSLKILQTFSLVLHMIVTTGLLKIIMLNTIMIIMKFFVPLINHEFDLTFLQKKLCLFHVIDEENTVKLKETQSYNCYWWHFLKHICRHLTTCHRVSCSGLRSRSGNCFLGCWELYVEFIQSPKAWSPCCYLFPHPHIRYSQGRPNEVMLGRKAS